MEKLAYSIDEFGKKYGLSRSTIYRLLEAKTLESVKVGKRRLIPIDAGDRMFNRLGYKKGK